MIAIKWGMICSVPDISILPKLESFGEWITSNLTKHGQKFYLSHDFEPKASFLLHATPNDAESIYAVYERVNREFSEVLYVIHILPVKNSLEFKLFKDITINYAIIGQGVLVDSALTNFAQVNLEEVFANMNQYISRRLSQIVSYRREENNFRLTVNGRNPVQNNNKSSLNFDNFISKSVDLVLHSSYDNPENSENVQNFLSKNTVEISGFPESFNKFQIASLFNNFRPIFVQIFTNNGAWVQFKNKFHAIQVVLYYNQRIIENFVLSVKSRNSKIQEKSKEISTRRLNLISQFEGLKLFH